MDIDISSLEEIEKKLGKILATNSVTNTVLESIGRIRTISSKQLVVWKARVTKDNEAYLNILGESSYDILRTLAEIENETRSLLKILHKLDQGASWHDVDLITNGRWIRLNTEFEPLIISDDRDLLTCGHILSSFLGLTLGFLSSFEILRLMELNDSFIKYCGHYGLNGHLGSINNTWSKEALEREVTNAMRKARIACHPNLRRNDSCLRIIRS